MAALPARRLLYLIPFLLPALLRSGRADLTADEAQCAGSLATLSPCLSYVSGSTNNLTENCCSGLKNILNTNKTCLCLIVKDLTDPQLSATLKLDKVLQLPDACQHPANIAECTGLLNLLPDSPLAQLFKQYANTPATKSIPPAVEGSITIGSVSSSGDGGGSGRAESHGAATGKKTVRTLLACGVWLWGLVSAL